MANDVEVTGKTMDWVLVAGTGAFHLPGEVLWTSRALGRELSRRGFGLVTGGWQGVDHVAAESFATQARAEGRALRDALIQVVPKGKQPEFKGGFVEMVEPGVHEWTESVRYGSALILAGGVGGTYETYEYALQEQRPVFALAGTGGDARRAYEDVISHWSLMPFHGVTREQYAAVLGRPIRDESEAATLAADVVELVWTERAAARAPRDRIFLSYSHKDRPWIDKVRAHLAPLSQTRGLTTWDDGLIDVGAGWYDEIKLALARTRVALLLVSGHFLASDFIKREELPRLIQAARSHGVVIAWIRLDDASVEGTALTSLQAAHDPGTPLGSLGEAAQVATLVEVRKRLERALLVR